MRSRANCNLQQLDFNTLLDSSENPRSRQLLLWLSNAEADAVDLLDWLCGQGIQIDRLENPSHAIVCSLPPASEFLEPVAREVLVSRLAQAIEWLASKSSSLSEFPADAWVEVFDLVRRLNDPLLRRSIVMLLETFDAIGTTPFAGDRELRRDFTDLVITHQIDDRLVDRWFALIRNSGADEVLYASLVDATRGLLMVPRQIKYDEFQTAFLESCDRIERSAVDKQTKAGLLNKIRRNAEQRNGGRTYFDIACSAHYQDYQWLPEASRLEHLAATTPDLAVLSNIANLGSKKLVEMAKVRYTSICGDLHLDPQLKVLIDERTSVDSTSEMETLSRYSKFVAARG